MKEIKYLVLQAFQDTLKANIYILKKHKKMQM